MVLMIPFSSRSSYSFPKVLTVENSNIVDMLKFRPLFKMYRELTLLVRGLTCMFSHKENLPNSTVLTPKNKSHQ